ncbi:hypothetical protein ASE00_19010 [Sphingomonas sp. Root710]|uniref:BLUF domain-containing protein n=1 Tax=Sphingomonas sp. Root710 TaxID=1736594 RepID=UPI0006F7D66F|nr:BLUF domain-containing protein [Sphingomonas sp. Root710]KRB79800.1 hypothetical protein ASE00_19010 [Sphingomonas sp. Root710]
MIAKPTHLIVYASRSLVPPAYVEREIADILTRSVQLNGRDGITGALLYTDDQRFAQALEGDAALVKATMDRIRKDVRHNRIVMLYDDVIAHRHFPDWSLAYKGNAPSIDQAIRAAEYEAPLPSTRALSDLLGIMAQLVGTG